MRKGKRKIILLTLAVVVAIAATIYSYASSSVELNVVTRKRLEVVLSKNESKMDTTNFQADVYNELSNLGVDNNLVTFHDADRAEVSTNASDAGTIFNSWGRIGLPGQWSYNASSGQIINAENTSNFTGFYYPNNFDYQDITLSYDNTTTDSDDDTMGSMIRFNVNDDGTVTTYVFMLDRHDNGGGTNNGAYNGLLKITKKPFQLASVQLLQHTSARWNRNSWMNYQVVAEANNIKVYQNGNLIIDYTDPDPIYSGSYGFFSYSQAYSKFANVQIQSVSYKSFNDTLLSTTFDANQVHAIINIADKEEADFNDSSLRGIILSRTLNEQLHYMGLGTSENQSQIQNFIAQNDGKGIFIDNTNYTTAVKQTAAYIKTLLDEYQTNSDYVILGEEMAFDINPSSLKTNTADSIYTRGKWKINHDYKYYENNNGQFAKSGQYISDFPDEFDKVGKYTITYEDDKIGDIYVHRRPVASFNIQRSGQNVNLTSTSYDLDKQSQNNGIQEEEWSYRKVNETSWTTGKLTVMDGVSDYIVKLRVKDYQNAWSEAETKYITNSSVKPVASFKLKNNQVSLYNNVEILDASYDPRGENLVSYKWTVTNSSGTEIYSGSTPLTNFRSYGLGKYTIRLVVTNQSGLESEEFSKEIDIVDDTTPPEFEANPLTDTSINKQIGVNLKFTDDESGFNFYKYAITYNDETELNWSSEIYRQLDTITLTDVDTDMYIHIIAQDRAGNESVERVIGPYRIESTAFDLEIHVNDQTDSSVSLGGAKFSLIHPIQNSPDNRIILYGETDGTGECHIAGQSMGIGEHEYIVYETQAPIGCDPVGLASLKIEFDADGKIIGVNKLYNDSIELVSWDQGHIVLNIKTKKNIENPFDFQLEVEDEDNNNIKVPGLSYNIIEQAQSGETLGVTGTTQSDGMFTISNQFGGTGQIVLRINDNGTNSSYIKDTEEKIVVLDRATDGTISFVRWQSSDFIQVDIMGNTVKVKLRAKKKEQKNQIQIKIAENRDKDVCIGGINVQLKEVSTSNIKTSVTGSDGIAKFDIDGYTGGVHRYEVKFLNVPNSYVNISAPMIIEVDYGTDGIIKTVTEITSFSYERKVVQDIRDTEIINTAIVSVGLDESTNYEAYKIRLVKKDQMDNTIKLAGVEYEFTITDGPVIKTTTKTTDSWGEIVVPVSVQSNTKITLQEIHTKPGYILDKTLKSIDLGYDSSGAKIVSNSSEISVELDKTNKTITVTDTNLKKLDDPNKKANISFYITKKDENGNFLGNVPFDMYEATTNTTYTSSAYPSLTTDSLGLAKYENFEVPNISSYRFEFTEASTIPGYLVAPTIKLEIGFEQIGDAINCNKFKIVGAGNEKYIEHKSNVLYETDDSYQMDVFLTIKNFVDTSVPVNPLKTEKIKLDIKNIDSTTNAEIYNGKYDVKIEYINGASTTGTIFVPNVNVVNGIEINDINVKDITSITLVEPAGGNPLGYDPDNNPRIVKLAINSSGDPDITNITSNMTGRIYQVTNTDYTVDNILELSILKNRKELSFDIKIVKGLEDIPTYVMQGATFNAALKTPTSNINLPTQITDSHGEILYSNLKGTGKLEISLEEIAVPYGFKLNSGVNKITVYRDPNNFELKYIPEDSDFQRGTVKVDYIKQLITIDFKNDLDFTINIEKVDKFNVTNKLKDAKFEIKSSCAQHLSKTIVTDANGLASAIYDTVVPDKVVNYRIKEIDPPQGFRACDQFTLRIEFNKAGKIKSYEILNVGGVPCDWAEVYLPIQHVVNPTTGAYELKEVYKNNSEITLRVYDTDRYKFVINKIDDSNQTTGGSAEPITGAEFDISVAYNGQSDTYHETTINGIASVADLEGTGEIVIDYNETQAAFGYENSALASGKIVINKDINNLITLDESKTTIDPTKIAIDNNLGIVKVTVTNDSNAKMGIRTIDAIDGTTLNGAVYTVTTTVDSSQAAVDTQSTTGAGEAIYSIGQVYRSKTVRYTIHENQAPTGYTRVYQPIQDIIIDVYFDQYGTPTSYNIVQGANRVVNQFVELNTTYNSTISYNFDKLNINLEITNGKFDEYQIVVTKENEKNDSIKIPGVKFQAKGINPDNSEQFNDPTLVTDYYGQIELNNVDIENGFKLSLKELATVEGYVEDTTERVIDFSVVTGSTGEKVVSASTTDTKTKVNVDNTADIIEIEITNEPKDVAISLLKIDKENTATVLNDAVFKLIDKQTGAEYPITTGYNGYGYTSIPIKPDGLAYKYDLIETTAPVGYKLAPTMTMEIDFNNNKVDAVRKTVGATEFDAVPDTTDGKYIDITVKDEENKKYEINLIKENAKNTAIKIPGTEFQIKGTDINGNQLFYIPTQLTDSNGKITQSDVTVEDGFKVEFKELNNVDGYEYDGTPGVVDFSVTHQTTTGTLIQYTTTDPRTTVEIDNVNNVINIRVTNEPKDIAIILNKVDAAEPTNKLADAKFDLVDVDTGITYPIIVGSNGIGYTSIPLKTNDNTFRYTLTETQEPLGYKQDTPMSFEVEFKNDRVNNVSKGNGGDVFDIVKDPLDGKYIEITVKDDEKDMSLPEYTVELHRVNKNNVSEYIPNAQTKLEISNNYVATITKSALTNSSGSIFVTNGVKGPGETIIKINEEAAVPGYVYDTSDRIVQLNRNSATGQVTKVSVSGNELSLSDVQIDHTNKIIKITLKSPKLKSHITTGPTNKNPFTVQIVSRVKGTNAPVVGYYSAVIAPDPSNPGPGWTVNSYNFMNKRTEKEYNTMWTEWWDPWKGTWVNNKYTELGTVTMSKLYGAGNFSIDVTQNQIPSGYIPLSGTQHIEIYRDPVTGNIQILDPGQETTTTYNGNNKIVITVTVTPTFTLNIQKQDSVNNLEKLEGVEFEITSNKGASASVVTNANGGAIALLGESYPNQTVVYTIRETKKPDGYKELDEMKLSVKFDNAGMIASQSITQGSNIKIFYPNQIYYTMYRWNAYPKVNTTAYKGTGHMEVIITNKNTFKLQIVNEDIDNSGSMIQGSTYSVTLTDDATGNQTTYSGASTAATDANGVLNVNNMKGSGTMTLHYEELQPGAGYRPNPANAGDIKIYKDPVDYRLTLLSPLGNSDIEVDENECIIKVITRNERKLELEIEKVEINKPNQTKLQATFNITSQVVERNGTIVSEPKQSLGTITTVLPDGLGTLDIGKADPQTTVMYELEETVPPTGMNKIGTIRLRVQFDQKGYVSKVQPISSPRAKGYKKNSGKIGVRISNGNKNVNAKGENVFDYSFKIQKTDEMITNYAVNDAVYQVKVYQNDSLVKTENITTQTNSISGTIVEMGMATLEGLTLDGTIRIEYTEATAPEGYKKDNNTYVLQFDCTYQQAVDYAVTKDIIPVLTLDTANTTIPSNLIQVDNDNQTILVNQVNDPEVIIGIRHRYTGTSTTIIPSATYRITSLEGTNVLLNLDLYDPVTDQNDINNILNTYTVSTSLNVSGTTGTDGETYISVGRPVPGKTVVYIIDKLLDDGTYENTTKLAITYDQYGKIAKYYLITYDSNVEIDPTEDYTGQSHVNINIYTGDKGIGFKIEKADSSLTFDVDGAIFEIVDDEVYDGTSYSDMTAVNLLREGIEQTQTINGYADLYLPKKSVGDHTFKIKEVQTPSGYQPNNDIIELKVTYDSDGNVTFADITQGNSIASINYSETNAEQVTMVVVNTQEPLPDAIEPYNLEVYKVDMNNKSVKIPGAELKVTVHNQIGVGSTTPLVTQDFTDSDGKIELLQINGMGEIDIKIEEITAPPGRKFDGRNKELRIIRETDHGYILNNNDTYAENVDLDIDNSTHTLKVYVINEQNDDLYTLYLAKVDDSGNMITNNSATFDIDLGDGNTQTYTTGDSGEIILQNLNIPAPGRYIFNIQETQEPTGYILTPGNVIQLQVDIVSQAGTNVIADVQPINGTGITVKKVAKNYIGLEVINNSKVGKFEVDIQKTDTNDVNIAQAGIEFEISEVGATTGSTTFTSDTNGKIQMTNIKMAETPGKVTYSIKEKKEPTGYILNTEEILLEVEFDEIGGIMQVVGANIIQGNSAKSLNCINNVIDFRVENEKANELYTFKLRKVDENGDPISLPATFDINLGYGVAQPYTTDGSGEILIQDIDMPQTPGTYTFTIQETQAPTGYNPITAVMLVQVQVSVVNGQKVISSVNPLSTADITVSDVQDNYIELEVKNTKIPDPVDVGKFEIDIQKTDINDVAIQEAGVIFEVKEAGTTNATQYTTLSDGKIQIPNIDMPANEGTVTYSIKEIQQPTGYKLNTDEILLELTFTDISNKRQITKAEIIQGNHAKVLNYTDELVELGIKNEKEDEPLFLTSNVYRPDTNNWIMSRVRAETTVTEFIDNLITNATTVTVYDKYGNAMGANDFVGTEMYVTGVKGSQSITYRISVVGDLTGDGEIDFVDVSRLRMHEDGIIPFSAVPAMVGNLDLYELAADIDDNGDIDFVDASKIRLHEDGIVRLY